MDLTVIGAHEAKWGNRTFRCAVGHNGFTAERAAKEGDGKTPVGRWIMREVFYRPDREKPPLTLLPTMALRPDDGWCDAPDDPNYNKFITHPYGASAERLWREDHTYDIIVVLGFNDDPVVPGKGSAIFLHVARPDFSPSGGCVALAREDLLAVLRDANKESSVSVAPSPW